MKQKKYIIVALLLVIVASLQAQTLTKLKLSAATTKSSLSGHGPTLAVDGNTSTYYSGGLSNFSLDIKLPKTIKAAKVRVKANIKGVVVNIGSSQYTQTLLPDDSFYVIIEDGYSSFNLTSSSTTTTCICYEVEVWEIPLLNLKLDFTYDATGNCTERTIILATSEKTRLMAAPQRFVEESETVTQNIVIYPNPTNGYIAVVSENDTIPNGQFNVYNNIGAQLLQGEWIKEGTLIDLSGNKNGSYILELIDAVSRKTYTIIKQ